MVSVPGWLLVHEVTVEPLTGVNAEGLPTYGAAVTHRCFVDDRARLAVLPDRRETVAASQVYLAADADPGPVGSRWTANGRTTVAIRVDRRDAGGLPAPSHIVVTLA